MMPAPGEVRERLIQFLRTSLGCGCPDEVLAGLAWAPTTVAGQPLLRIAVGGRLLVYLWRCDSPAALTETLPALLDAGRRERDGEGFARFRLAIASGDETRLGPVARRLFADWPDRDAQTFLHLCDARHAVACGAQTPSQSAPSLL